MTEEREFDYRDYIQRRLREIDDLDERRYAKGLLLDSLGEMFAWTEAKYKALEQRIRDELDSPWERFDIAMTAVSRADYDPVNDFWHPVCAEDLGPDAGRERVTVYLMADDAGCRRFLRQGIVEAEDAVTGAPLRFRIERPGATAPAWRGHTPCSQPTISLGGRCTWGTWSASLTWCRRGTSRPARGPCSGGGLGAAGGGGRRTALEHAEKDTAVAGIQASVSGRCGL